MAKVPIDRPLNTATRLIRAGSGSDTAGLARTVNPPVQRGSTILMDKAADLYAPGHVTYGRQGLSAQDALIEGLDALEGAAGTCLYPSGLAAVTGALLALLKGGDEILVTDAIYAPTRRFCDKVLRGFGVSTRYFAPDADPGTVMALATPATRLILLESPGSLSFEMQDVPAIARLARERGILTAIDNTWAAGLTFRPLEHGVDVSIQALTKYVGGHSDLFMGSASASDPQILARLREGIVNVGWSVSPDDAYLMLRGLKTLPTRMDRQFRAALQVAEWLEGQPEVAEVICPFLPGARGHDLWKRDFSGGCGLFGAVLRPAPDSSVHALLDALALFGLGYSWGGFESLAIHCDPQLAYRARRYDYGGPMVRFHVGLEDPADLIADLRGGLDAFAAAPSAG